MTTSPLRPTRHLLSPLVAAAVVAALTSAPATAGSPTLLFRGPLQDLQPAGVDPFDGARATVRMGRSAEGTTVVLKVKGADVAFSGTSFGAHLHTGPCIAGDPAAAGPHYNASTSVPPVVNDQTEVWLDLTLTGAGAGTSVASVPFTPAPGARSVVIHALPTDPAGAAGPRLACLPVVWS